MKCILAHPDGQDRDAEAFLFVNLPETSLHEPICALDVAHYQNATLADMRETFPEIENFRVIPFADIFDHLNLDRDTRYTHAVIASIVQEGEYVLESFYTVVPTIALSWYDIPRDTALAAQAGLAVGAFVVVENCLLYRFK